MDVDRDERTAECEEQAPRSRPRRRRGVSGESGSAAPADDVFVIRVGRQVRKIARDKVAAMRVVRVITRPNVGGPAIQAMTLSDRLASRGFETVLVHGQLDAGEGDMRYLLPPSVDVKYLAALRRPLAPAHDGVALAQLLDVMRDFRPQIVHTHMAKAGTLGRAGGGDLQPHRPDAAIAPVWCTRITGTCWTDTSARPRRGVFSASNARWRAPPIASSPSRRASRPSCSSSTASAGPTNTASSLWASISPALAAIDDDARARARAALEISGRRRGGDHRRPPDRDQAAAAVSRGRAADRRRVSCRRISDRRATASCVRELEASAATLGLADRVRFLGWRRDLETIYGATDVFLLTSRNEGTPVALIESLAAGCAGVSTDVGGVRGRARAATPSACSRRTATRPRSPAASRRCSPMRIGAGAWATPAARSVVARYGLDRLVDRRRARCTASCCTRDFRDDLPPLALDRLPGRDAATGCSSSGTSGRTGRRNGPTRMDTAGSGGARRRPASSRAFPTRPRFVPEVLRTPLYSAVRGARVPAVRRPASCPVALAQTFVFVLICLVVCAIARRVTSEPIALGAAGATRALSADSVFRRAGHDRGAGRRCCSRCRCGWRCPRLPIGTCRRFAWLGVLLALTTLSRPVFVLFPFALAGSRPRRASARCAFAGGRALGTVDDHARGVRAHHGCRGSRYNYVTLGRFTLSPAGGVGRGLWEGSWQATWSGRLQNELTHLADDIDDRAELDRRVRGRGRRANSCPRSRCSSTSISGKTSG